MALIALTAEPVASAHLAGSCDKASRAAQLFEHWLPANEHAA